MPKQIILVASRDLNLAQLRRTVLEDSGYEVVSVFHADEIDEVCNERKIDAVVIGYSVEPIEKRRIWSRVREGFANTFPPILELTEVGGPPILIDSHQHEFANASDFVVALNNILRPR